MRSVLMALLSGLLALLAVALPAASWAAPPKPAEPAPEMAVGLYRLSEASSLMGCRVDLTDTPAAGGWRLILSPDCTRLYGVGQPSVAWAADPAGGVRFLDAEGATTLAFAGPDYLIAPRPGRPDLVLDRTTEERFALSDRQRMTGGLTLADDNGKPLCRFDSTAGRYAATGRLKARPGCPASWAGADHWETMREQMTLLDARGGVVMVMAGTPYDGFYAPNDGQPLRLLRDEDFRRPSDGMVGPHRLRLEKDGRTAGACLVDLSSRWAEGGWAAEQAGDCEAMGLGLSTVWTLALDGTFQLKDARGAVTVAFEPTSDLVIEKTMPDGGILHLEPAGPPAYCLDIPDAEARVCQRAEDLPRATIMTSAWTFLETTAEGVSTCTMVLIANADGTAGEVRVSGRPGGCFKASPVRLAARWSRDDDLLVLYDVEGRPLVRLLETSPVQFEDGDLRLARVVHPLPPAGVAGHYSLGDPACGLDLSGRHLGAAWEADADDACRARLGLKPGLLLWWQFWNGDIRLGQSIAGPADLTFSPTGTVAVLSDGRTVQLHKNFPLDVLATPGLLVGDWSLRLADATEACALGLEAEDVARLSCANGDLGTVRRWTIDAAGYLVLRDEAGAAVLSLWPKAAGYAGRLGNRPVTVERVVAKP